MSSLPSLLNMSLCTISSMQCSLSLSNSGGTPLINCFSKLLKKKIKLFLVQRLIKVVATVVKEHWRTWFISVQWGTSAHPRLPRKKTD